MIHYNAVVGVDPGGEGAATLINLDGVIVEIVRFKDKQPWEIALELRYLRHYTFKCFREQVSSRTGQGIASSFKFGYNTGIADGIFATLDTEIHLIDPKVWQREFNLGGKQGAIDCTESEEKTARKNAHKRKAIELYPDQVVTLDRADSILIATYGWRKMFGELTHGKIKKDDLRPGRGVVSVQPSKG